MKLVESLIGWEVTVGQGSECHLTFVRGTLHIANEFLPIPPLACIAYSCALMNSCPYPSRLYCLQLCFNKILPIPPLACIAYGCALINSCIVKNKPLDMITMFRWMSVVTQTNCSNQSFCKQCFGGVFVLSLVFYSLMVYWLFIRMSQISISFCLWIFHAYIFGILNRLAAELQCLYQNGKWFLVWLVKQNSSTEGYSKLKRSVDMTSSGKNGLNIRTNTSTKWDRTRCTEE